jgi:hypothetical protein
LISDDDDGNLAGSEYKEFQVSALADLVEFSQPASFIADWNTTAEQSDGTMVIDAFPNASCLPVSP